MERRQYQDYVEANRQILDALVKKIEAQLAVHPHRRLLYKSADEVSFRIVEGAYTSETYEDSEPSEGQAQDPQLRADEANEDLINGANKLVSPMLGILALLHAMEGYVRPPDDHQGEIAPLPFKHAVNRVTSYDDDDDPSVSGSIESYEFFDKPETPTPVAAHYYIRHSKDGIAKALLLNLIDGKVAHAETYVAAGGDDLFDRCYDMFGPDSVVMDLMDGDFETVDQLESNLKSIAKATIGIFPAAEVEALIAEVRASALRSYENSIDPLDTGHPTLEELKEFLEILENIE